MGFIFALKQFLMLPFTILAGIWQFFRDMVANPQGSRIALLAFPAVLIGFAALAIVLVALWGREERVVKQYTLQAEAARAEATQLMDEKIMPKLRDKKINPQIPLLENLDEGDEDVVRFKSLRKKEQECWEKLVQIEPESKKYRFEHALSFASVDEREMMNLLEKLAPVDKPGYAPAHARIAVGNFNLAARMTGAESSKRRQNALIHAKHCLALEPDNRECRIVRAQIFYAMQNFGEALQDFTELVKTDAVFFRQVLDIQNRLGMKKEFEGTMADALTQLESKFIPDNRSTTPKWSTYMESYVDLAAANREFERLQKFLNSERSLAAGDSGKEAYLGQYEGFLYARWAMSLNLFAAEPKPEALQQGLEYLKSALAAAPRQPLALIQLTQLGIRKDDWGSKALELYDPTKDANAPAMVLSFLGKHMFGEQNFSAAVEYYERARRASPNDPEILNNLAFGYLVTNVDTPDKALGLVESALRAAAQAGVTDKLIYSSMYHTKGTALARLDRLEEAAASFELALEGRPDEVKILQQIVDCYLKINPKQAEVYQRKLELLQSRQKTEAGG